MKAWAWILCGALILGMGAGEIRLEDRKPASLLYVTEAEGEIIAETEAGDRGSGKDLPEAIRQLLRQSEGLVILDTLNFLVVEKSAGSAIRKAASLLHPGILVCLAEGEINPKEAEEYLAGKGKGVTLLHVRQGEEIFPVLEKGRWGYQWKED